MGKGQALERAGKKMRRQECCAAAMGRKKLAKLAMVKLRAQCERAKARKVPWEIG